MTANPTGRWRHLPNHSRQNLVRYSIPLLLLSTVIVGCQKGNFDSTTPNPVDEAYIFTPPGRDTAGVLSKVEKGPRGTVRVKIIDAATGKPTFCRVNVVGSDGNFYQPTNNKLATFGMTGEWPKRGYGNRPGKAPIRYFGRFFYTDGVFEVDVPPGMTRVETWKGFEYAPATFASQVAENRSTEMAIKLQRTVPMAPEGYYSGDTHLHLPRDNDADAETCLDLLEAEDVQFGGILCYNLDTSHYSGAMNRQTYPQRQGLGKASERERNGYRILSGQEYRSGQFGHLKVLLQDRLVREGDNFDPNDGPAYGRIGDEIHERGGLAFHAHGGYAQEIWADFVQGSVDGVELLQFGIYRGIGLEGWYRIWNAGYRLPAIGASDFPPCRKMSDCRTYAYCESAPDFPAWLRAVAAGHSFVTTGPFLLLEADGNKPGSVMELKSPGPHRVNIRIRARGEVVPIQHVQCVIGGRVFKQWDIPAAEQLGRWFETTQSVPIDGPTWIAARAYSLSPSGSPDGESHTNPIQVLVDGNRPFDKESIKWLVKRIDEQIEEHQNLVRRAKRTI
ncbi:MAG: CehA/McbA family metallohydrolase [Planctomycetota bacterium]